MFISRSVFAGSSFRSFGKTQFQSKMGSRKIKNSAFSASSSHSLFLSPKISSVTSLMKVSPFTSQTKPSFLKNNYFSFFPGSKLVVKPNISLNPIKFTSHFSTRNKKKRNFHFFSFVIFFKSFKRGAT